MSNHWFGMSRELKANSRPNESRRQAVDEALHEVPPQHKQVVKLAFFAGLTNREIAQELGLNVSEVRRVLRSNLASVGAHLERGRAKGRRAIQDLAMLPLWKIGQTAQRTPWPSLDHVLQTGVVAVMTAAAAALLVTHQAPVHVGHAHKPAHAATVGSAGSNVIQIHTATLVEDMHPRPQTAVNLSARRPAPVSALPVRVAVQLPVAVADPSLVSKPRISAFLQLPFGA